MREILSDAEETDWGLFHLRSSVASHFPGETEEVISEQCRTAMRKLVEEGLVTLYWLSAREATETEASAERKRILDEVGLTSPRGVFVPLRDDIPLAPVDAVLADDANWQPPIEDRYVAFAATTAGREAYFALPPRVS